ncbi:MAG: hypothetical protein AMXMBFR4_33160 [Candidatus Hydrogenedentota bacterium]
MKRFARALTAAAIIVGVAAAELQNVQVNGGAYYSYKGKQYEFKDLFNGKDLTGWWVRKQDTSPYQVKEGGILRVTGEEPHDWLFTDGEYRDFVIRYEYRCVSGEGNSGVGIRATKEDNPAFSGMEIQVIRPGWENSWQRSGALYAAAPPAVIADRPFGEWNSVQVECIGNRVRTIMNGQELYDIKITNYTPEFCKDVEWMKPLTGRAEKGHIAIQNHGDAVEFRNIQIAALPDVTAEGE